MTVERNNHFSICICTYNRVNLLERLLGDVQSQSLFPRSVIIVDGYPQSKEVVSMLEGKNYPWELFYVPSNHGNLAYQRYLGWRIVKDLNPLCLVYFDDDLRLKDENVLWKLTEPFLNDSSVVGVTSQIVTGDPSEKFSEVPILIDRAKAKEASNFNKKLVKWFGSSRNMHSGGLTPTGHRVTPKKNGNTYLKVDWLSGRVMVYRMDHITNYCFSEDLFALTHIDCGMGEDTILSNRIGRNKKMLLACNIKIFHPDDALPNSYPTKAYKLGYAISYSRRLINDDYRWPNKPQTSDRFHLLKSYVGNNVLNWWNAFLKPKKHRFAYAWGYLRGSIRGLIQKPTAQNLTPEIDWWAEAEEALENVIRI